MPHSAVGAVALGEHLYVCGGFDGISSLDTVEKYDPTAKNWTLVASMTKNRSAAGKLVWRSHISVHTSHSRVHTSQTFSILAVLKKNLSLFLIKSKRSRSIKGGGGSGRRRFAYL